MNSYSATICLSLPAILYQDGLSDLQEARKAYHHFQDLLDLTFYGALGQIHAEEYQLTTTVPDISYKELVSELLEHTEEAYPDYASERIHRLLETCRLQNVMPSRLIQYFVQFLSELEYQLTDVSAASHDMIAESFEYIRNADTMEELERHLQNVLKTVFTADTDKPNAADQYSAEVLQSLSYIQDNYGKKISLASVADHVGLSSGYLCRIFKDETGVSINSYINNLRMTRAGELLADKNSYIKEVAISVGFEDQLYFSRLFKRYYGITPSEYRAGKAGN